MGEDPKLFYMLKYLGILWYEWQDRQQAAWGDGMLGPTLCGDSGRATFPSLVPCPEFLWTACLCSWKRQLHPFGQVKKAHNSTVHRMSREEYSPQEQKEDFHGVLDSVLYALCNLLQWNKPQGEAGTDSHCWAWRRPSETDRVQRWVYTENSLISISLLY